MKTLNVVFALLLLSLAACEKKSSVAPSLSNQTDDQYCAENPEKCTPQVNPGVDQ